MKFARLATVAALAVTLNFGQTEAQEDLDIVDVDDQGLVAGARLRRLDNFTVGLGYVRFLALHIRYDQSDIAICRGLSCNFP